MAALLEVSCLGDLKARLDGVSVPGLDNSKPLALWLYLALREADCSRAHLADVFWGELDEAAARTNLRLALLRLRRSIPEHIAVTRLTAAVPPGVHRIDTMFLPVPGDLEPESVEKLLKLRPEEFLAGLRLRHAPQFDEWVSAERERLVAEHISTLTRVAEHLVTDGVAARAIDVYRRCLSLAPWSEVHHRALIRCYIELGQQTAALAQFNACRRALRRELDVEPDQITRRLIESANSAPATRTIARQERDFFERLTVEALDPAAPLVIRSAEREYLTGLLQGTGCRLVSVVGPGGVGKTHLALQVAESIAKNFRDGCCFVPLADVHPQLSGQSESLVESRLAEALTLPRGATTRETLLDVLAERELLLVIDNFEQLTEAAGLIETISLRAPRVRVLVTSRHRLELATEWVMRLNGLACPPDGECTSASLAYPAVELFAKTAALIEAGFDTHANGSDIVRICRAVEGSPLAITLAARWLGTMSCREIGDRLSEDLSLLRMRRDLGRPERHQNLAVVFEQSWALLDEAERTAFSGMCVFRGGFAPRATTAIVKCDLAVVDRLVNKSFLRRRSDGRLEIHELMRDLGEEKLKQNPERMQALCEQHAAYYAALIEEELAQFKADPLTQTFEQTRRELGNLIATFEHRLNRGEIGPLAALLEALWVFHKRLGWFADGAALLRRSLALPSVPLELACRWQLWLSDACFQLGRHDECKEAVLTSLEALGEPAPGSSRAVSQYLLRELFKRILPARWVAFGGPREKLRDDAARTHNRLGQIYFFEGNRFAYLATTLRSMNVAAGTDAVEHWASGALVFAHTPLRPLAARYARRAARSIRQTEPFARAWAHEQLSLYALGIGDFANAEHDGRQGAKLFWKLGQHKNWSECAGLSANAVLLRGELDAARECFAAMLPRACQRRERFGEIWALCGLAHIELRSGGRPAADLGASAEAVGGLIDPNTALLYFGNVAWTAARGGHFERTFEAIDTCRRLVARSTMLSIYALHGFIAQVMALAELAAASDGIARQPRRLSALAAGVLADAKRFSAPFPAARPYSLYLAGRWFSACGQRTRGEALCIRGLHRLALAVEPETFAAGFAAVNTAAPSS